MVLYRSTGLWLYRSISSTGLWLYRSISFYDRGALGIFQMQCARTSPIADFRRLAPHSHTIRAVHVLAAFSALASKALPGPATDVGAPALALLFPGPRRHRWPLAAFYRTVSPHSAASVVHYSAETYERFGASLARTPASARYARPYSNARPLCILHPASGFPSSSGPVPPPVRYHAWHAALNFTLVSRELAPGPAAQRFSAICYSPPTSHLNPPIRHQAIAIRAVR
ncbi:hypothetical protein B0H10DRAFT_2237415 [Mycena sp. CBHHK59/15]|nr:hypothetical protein B0H10DRAFT_2237415 [Mycena sp. CBHHK59/15]